MVSFFFNLLLRVFEFIIINKTSWFIACITHRLITFAVASAGRCRSTDAAISETLAMVVNQITNTPDPSYQTIMHLHDQFSDLGQMSDLGFRKIIRRVFKIWK